jgi:CxxC motif-containing protein (DUF1111 family)
VTGTSVGSGTNAAAVSSYTGPVPTVDPGVVDPGVRGGPPGAGTPIAGLNANELALFNEGKFRTVEEEATCDTCNDIPLGQPIPPDAPVDTTNSAGLGGRFNHTSCTLGCHSQPSIGGTSPALNPSFAAAKAKGATNVVPSFESMDGPTREIRFRFNPDGTRDGSVHQKFTVTGRSDAPSCTLAQPDFETEYANDNLSFRVPTPLFGLGLIDSIQDNEILSHQQANADYKASLGIHGVTNNSPNDATISRFGWKAQNKSLTQFAGEAYAVELGITNDLNPTSKTEDDNCTLTEEPSDLIHTGDGSGHDATDNFNVPIDVLPVWMTFTTFMRFMDQPTPVAFDDSATRGSNTFNQIGCAECHTPSMQTKSTGQVPLTEALRGQTANLFSDLLIHHMGATLADNIVQGNAGPDMFRTAPLWGLGQRIFFLHDGRETDLVATIMDHFSKSSKKSGLTPAYPASEANQVVANFFALSTDQQQDVINFLRSL